MSGMAVLMPVFNGLNYTKKTLAWLFKSITINVSVSDAVDVVVIDDGSTDGSSDWIHRHYPKVHIVKGDGNLWWTGSINEGAKYALNELKSEYIVLWNNDIKPDINYFRNLLLLLSKAEPGALIASKLLYLDAENTIWQMGCLFNPVTGQSKVIGADETDSERYQEVIRADWASGMGLVIHKSIIEKVGLLDYNAFPQYHSDSDFCLRAKSVGISLYVHPELKIWNDRSSSGHDHDQSIVALIRGLFKMNSLYNIGRQVKFTRRHADSVVSYFYLIELYCKYVGGFIKRKAKGLVNNRK